MRLPSSPISICLPSMPLSIIILAIMVSRAGRGVMASSSLPEDTSAFSTSADVDSSQRRSRKKKRSQDTRNGSGVLLSPIPMTIMPASRRRMARRVKSLSEVARQKPSTLPEYRISIASMIIAESVEFFPVV